MDRILENNTHFVDSEDQKFFVVQLEDHLDTSKLQDVGNSVDQFTGRSAFSWNVAAEQYINLEIDKFLIQKYPLFLDNSGKSNIKLDLGELLVLANNFMWASTGGHDDKAEGQFNTDVKTQINLETRPQTRCEIFNKAFIHVFEDLCSKFNPELLDKHKLIVTDSSLAMQLIRDNLEYVDSTTQAHTYCSLLSRKEEGFIVTPIDPYHVGHRELRDFNDLDFSASRGADSIRAISRLTRNQEVLEFDDTIVDIDFRILVNRIHSLIIGESTSLNFSLLPIYLKNFSLAKETIVVLKKNIERDRESIADNVRWKEEKLLLFENQEEYMKRHNLDKEGFNFNVEVGVIAIPIDRNSLNEELEEMEESIQFFQRRLASNTKLQLDLQMYSDAYKSITEIILEDFLREGESEDILNAIVMFDEITSVGMRLDASLIELIETKLDNINTEELEERIYGKENWRRKKVVVRRSSSKLMQNFAGSDSMVSQKDQFYEDLSENYLDSFYRIKLKYFDKLMSIGRIEWIRSLPETFIGDSSKYSSFVEKVIANLNKGGFDVEARKLRNSLGL